MLASGARSGEGEGALMGVMVGVGVETDRMVGAGRGARAGNLMGVELERAAFQDSREVSLVGRGSGRGVWGWEGEGEAEGLFAWVRRCRLGLV